MRIPESTPNEISQMQAEIIKDIDRLTEELFEAQEALAYLKDHKNGDHADRHDLSKGESHDNT